MPMPIPLDHADQPRAILLFDDTAAYYQPLTAALTLAKIPGAVETVKAAFAFRLALTRTWDAILVAYPVVQEALTILSQIAPDQEIILLYAPQAEEQAFALTAEQISDLVSCAALRRLPLILQRAWKRKARQTDTHRLRQLETRFRAIVEGFGDTILIADGYQLIRYANPAFGRSFGYRFSQLVGRSFDTLLHPTDRAALQESLARCLAAVGAVHTVAHRLQRTDGDWAFVETTAHSMHDPEGQTFLVLHVRDVSDRRWAEEALLESEQRLRLFVEHAPAAIAMFDRNMNYLSASRRWLVDYRLNEESIIGRSHYEVFPEIPAQWRAIHQRCLQGAVEKRDADAFPRQDGALDWVRWEIRPWRNIYDEIGGIIFFSEVITERIQAEAAEHEQRLLAETMRDSLAVLTSTLDVEAVLEQILALSARVVPSEAGAIVLFDGNQGHVAYSRGHAPEVKAFFKANPILLETGMYTQNHDQQTYYLAPDTHLTPGWVTFPVTAWVRSSIGVQIVVHGDTIGLLIADSRTPHQYGQKDVEKLQTFARYAALALENAHHVTHLEQRVQARTAELEATKTQVEAILDNSPDAILLVHADLTIQQANQAFHQLFHCEPNACYGNSLLERIAQADREQVKALLQSMVTTAQRNQLEIRAQRRDGTNFDAELSVGLIKNDGLVCIIRDISERKVQERQLQYHASLQKTVSDAVIVTDMASRVQSWNVAAERIYGWRAAEAVGRTMGELVRTQFNFPEERAYLLERLQAQGWWYGEFIQQRKNGQICHILSSAALVNDKHGNPIGMVAVNHDITERKEAEDALQKSAAEIRDLYNNAPCGYHSLDQDGLIVQINDTELRWLGYTRTEVVGRIKFADIITPASMQVFQKNFSIFKARGWASDLQFELVRKDGTTQPVLLSSTAVYADGNYVQSRSTLFDMTELRQAQQAIIESEARYRLLAENAFDMVTRHNLAGDFLYVSPATQRLLGYSSDELIGQRGFAMFYPEQWAQMGALMGEASRPDSQPAPQIFRVRHKAGHDILLEINVRGIFAETTGELVEFVSTARDVTAQQQAAAALRASEEKFRQVAENFDHLLFIRAPDTPTMLYINSAAERLTGLSRAQMYADPQCFLNCIHPDDRADVQQQQQSPAFLAEGRADLEYRFIRPDGQIRWFRVRTFPIKNEEGVIISRVGTSEDITERKEAELAQQESEAKYRRLVETMRGGLVMFDADDLTTYVNDRFCELAGYPRAELIGQKAFAHLQGQNVELIKSHLERRRQLQSSSYELTFQRPDGQLVHLLSSGSPLVDKMGNYQGGFAVITDITAQKQAEAALRQALAKEKELSDLKSRFVSVASHEFRTPLATISATTETLIAYRDRLDYNQLNARLHKILIQVDHMKAIMEDVLQLARIQAGRVELMMALGDLHALCCEIIEEFRSRPEYKERIIYTVDGTPSAYCFDTRLMRHVVSNLISNGLKYSPAAQPITIGLYWAAQTITLQVRDQGIGIPDADRHHLFEPFHRAGNVGNISGTGLGLSITKEAVEMHGGTIQIETEINKGTIFTVVLPTTPERITADGKDPDY